MDLKDKVCGQYEITDYENLKVKHVKDLPLNSCGGVFGFSTKDISPVLNWSRDAIKYGKEHYCQ